MKFVKGMLKDQFSEHGIYILAEEHVLKFTCILYNNTVLAWSYIGLMKIFQYSLLDSKGRVMFMLYMVFAQL